VTIQAIDDYRVEWDALWALRLRHQALAGHHLTGRLRVRTTIYGRPQRPKWLPLSQTAKRPAESHKQIRASTLHQKRI
jgi:hypothetical protein